MTFFDDAELAALRIERLVFHLVGPTSEDFVRLEEIRPGKFAEFFLDRIRSVGGGAAYEFSDASATRERLARIAADASVFQEESELLAQDFQRRHGGSSAKGAFLIAVLATGDGQAFALLKYDDERVLSYELEDAEDGRKRVALDALERTLVQNREALQKAVLVRLRERGGDLLVLDRQNQQKVARFFEGFLDAVRLHDDAALTAKLVAVTRQVIRENRDLVPPEVFRQAASRTHAAASGGGSLAADGQKGFLDAVLGQTLPDDSPLLKKFVGALRRNRIDGAPVKLDARDVRPPTGERIRTKNGIQIQVPGDVRKFVIVEEGRIIINDTLESRSDDAEGPL